MLASKGRHQHREQMPTRGYLSTVSNVLHFGLKSGDTIDSLLITWPGGKQQLLRDIKPNQLITLNEEDASAGLPGVSNKTLFVKSQSPVQHTHR